MLVSLNELGITVGILIAFLVNYIFTDVENGWRYMFSLNAVAAIVQGVAMIFLPQTPQFLMIKRQVCALSTVKVIKVQSISPKLSEPIAALS